MKKMKVEFDDIDNVERCPKCHRSLESIWYGDDADSLEIIYPVACPFCGQMLKWD